MLDRRNGVFRNLLYLALVATCFYFTWNLWGVGRAVPLIAGLGVYGTLIGALSLSHGVPFARPRPTVAAAIALALWGLALLHLALTAQNGDSVSSVGLIALAGLLIPLFFGGRLKRFTKTKIWLGASITVAALCLGALALVSSAAPLSGSGGIGFTSGITHPTESKRGLLLRLNVFPQGCSGVDAEVLVFGTSEFWARHPSRMQRIPLQIVMPIGSANDASVQPVTNSVEAANDTAPGGAPISASPIYENGRPQLGPARRLNFRAGVNKVSTYGKYELIDAWVSGNWSDVRAPVAFRFKPDWLTGNGLESCYLQTPPLVGAEAWPEIDAPIWSHIRHANLVLPSSGSVFIYDAGYTGGPSRPGPAAATAAFESWSCGVDANSLRPIGLSRAIESYPLRWYEEPPLQDCGELTPLEDPGAKTLQTLIIFVVGGLVSLGLTIAVLSEKELRDKRRTGDSRPA